MVTKNRIVTGGNKALATDFNENVLQPLSNMDNTDNTDSNAASSSYGTNRTLVIDAGAISEYIIIKGQIIVGVTDDSFTSVNTTTMQLTIDSVQKFETSVTVTAGISDGSNTTRSFWSRNFEFKYIPTSDEKTNGFTLDLDLKYTRSNGSAHENANSYWSVWGA